MVQTSMIDKDSWLAEESQTIKLEFGLDEDGKINGNILTPTVAMTPNKLMALETKASFPPPNREKPIAPSAPTKPKIGASKNSG